MKQFFKAALAGSFRVLLGRRNQVRFARFLLNHGRMDVPNKIERNGELLALQSILDLAKPGQTLRVFDVGANVGRWSRYVLTLAADRGITDVDLHAFEPSSTTFGMLEEQMRAAPLKDKVHLVNAAMSDEPGEMTLYIIGDGAGTNSLHASTHEGTRYVEEKVRVGTVDRYLEEQGVDRLTLLKIDAEGHDINVLKGAKELLTRQAVDFVQIEYNWRWIAARHFLKDLFDVLEGTDYRVGKITPKGIEFYDGWHAELESFCEGNYLVARGEAAAKMPTIRWWNAAG